MEEEVVEVATKVAFQFKPMVLAATAVVSLAAGTALGLIVGTRRAEKKYAELAKREIAEAKHHYDVLHKVNQYATPEQAAAALIVEKIDTTIAKVELPPDVAAAIRDYSGGHDPRPSLEEQNIFSAPKPDPATLLETSGKFITPTPIKPGPFVITSEEFNDSEVGFNQVSLTYFAGDEILADEDDSPILEVEETVGDALEHFDENENVVFVRNTRIDLDFEITRSFGKYGEEVAGLGEEPKHSDSRYPARKRRRNE